MTHTRAVSAVVFLALFIGAALPELAVASGAGHDSTDTQCPAASKWADAYVKRMHAEVKVFAKVKPRNPKLASELARRASSDQKARHAVMDASAKPGKADYEHVLKVDRSNLVWLKKQVDAHGFPSVAQVGVKGVQDAWLLTQHADSDPAFQAQVLAQLKPRLKYEDFILAEVAMLTDRVRLAQHKKQIYGSQFRAKDGRWVLRPVENPAHLDARRARMNLMPIAEYRCVLNASYGMPSKQH